MKIKRPDILIAAAMLLFVPIVRAQLVREIVEQGNALYADANYSEAITKYDEAIADLPEALEPVFNKADSLYRMDDFTAAIQLYNNVAVESRDMKLVNAARYNNGNCFFQRGLQKKDAEPQKAIEDIKTAISYWRKVLDAECENEKAARNIEVARLTIKDILDQPRDPNQQNPNQPQDPNQAQDPNQQQQNQQQDPNQAQDPNQQQQNQQQDPNQQQQADEEKDEKKPPEPDSTAQEILDREQKQKEERQMLKVGGYKKVEKDW